MKTRTGADAEVFGRQADESIWCEQGDGRQITELRCCNRPKVSTEN